MKEGVYSVGRVLVSRRVAIECITTVGRIIDASRVQRQRINADGRVEVPDGVAFERRETNRGIVYAAGETQKGILSFCRVKSRVAAVRWWADRLHVLDECEADERKCNYDRWNVWFHIRGFSEKCRQLVDSILRKRESTGRVTATSRQGRWLHRLARSG